MTTWIGHLRLAENLINDGFDFDLTSFIVGSNAPDSGVPTGDLANPYNPSKKVTHWRDDNGGIQHERFYEEYLSGKKLDKASRSFLVAYYLHLIADVEWIKQIWRPTKEQIPAGAEKDPDMIEAIKTDWYGLDFVYLNEQPDCLFYTYYQHIDTVPDYLDYFPIGALTERLHFIQNFYLETDVAFLDSHNFQYLTQGQMDEYIVTTTTLLENVLNNLHPDLIA